MIAEIKIIIPQYKTELVGYKTTTAKLHAVDQDDLFEQFYKQGEGRAPYSDRNQYHLPSEYYENYKHWKAAHIVNGIYHD